MKPTLLMLPPLGHDKTLYAPLMKLLKDKFEILALDYPYVDQHTVFNWETDSLLESLAQYFVREARKSLKQIDYIFGVSLGATLSLRMNEILNNEPRRLFLVASGGFAVARSRKEIILQSLKELGPEAFLNLAMCLEGNDCAHSALAKNFSKVDQNLEQYWQHYTRTFWDAAGFQWRLPFMINLIHASLEVNYTHLIESYQDKETIIWGEQDKVFSLRFYRKFQNAAPRAEFHLLPGVGHFPPLEEPEKIRDILEQTLRTYEA